MTSLPVVIAPGPDCWKRICVWGDRTCPELAQVFHCHNCQVFTRAGRRFLDAASPEGYLEEWTRRLAVPLEESSTDLLSVLTFRLAEEWLALPVQVLVEVTSTRRVHRIPPGHLLDGQRTATGGVLAGLVNIRGELHLCVYLDQVLGISRKEEGKTNQDRLSVNSSFLLQKRLLVVRRERAGRHEQREERWVFPVDEVDQVHRFPASALTAPPATVARALGRLSRGLFHWQGRSIGLVDDARLFQTLGGKIR